MNYAEIKKYDIANGPGVRISLFVSGCTIHCKGCFNPETWNPNYGKSFGEEQIKEIKEFLSFPYVKGLTILGGEPLDFDHPKELYPLVHMVHEMKDKDIWIFSGHTLNWILKQNNPDIERLLLETDVLVDGCFIEELKDPSLKFRGSKNQTIINIGNTLKHYIDKGVLDIEYSEYQGEVKDKKELLRERRMKHPCNGIGLLGKVGPLPDEEDKK